MIRMMPTSGDYIVRLTRLPPHVKAVTAIDENGFANIYVNDQLSVPEQSKAVLHELNHIMRDDAYNSFDIRLVEE